MILEAVAVIELREVNLSKINFNHIGKGA